MPSEPGPMTLSIEPRRPLPCIYREFEIELEPGSVNTLELGEHEVRFRAVDDRGTPLGNVELDLDDAKSGRRYNSIELRNYERLFLPTGNYRFHARTLASSPLLPVSLVANIEADTLLTFVFHPAEIPD